MMARKRRKRVVGALVPGDCCTVNRSDQLGTVIRVNEWRVLLKLESGAERWESRHQVTYTPSEAQIAEIRDATARSWSPEERQRRTGMEIRPVELQPVTFIF